MNTDTFGMWIKARRKQLDLTQEALAERIGCSLSAIRKIEKDERRPSRQIAELLALHLEVPPEERTLFLQTARGEGNLRRLGNASAPTGKLVAVTESLSPASNIPASATPFIGRQQESDSLARMLTDPRQRLITILGPGGIGKTRLAMEAANLHLATFDQRVYFIQLTAFQTAESILPAIAATLNIPSASAEELKTRLIDYLRDKKALLVLDNFEHLIEGAPLLSELLQKLPHLKLLVTSRERLNLQGEWTFELGGLTVPPQADEGKAVYSALQLFELHAHRIRPDLQLVGSEREAVIRICQRVDGMPLAIELAAAWVNVLSCEEIANEIERGFDFLSSTLRDTPERHRSLRAAFEHSWKRLTGAEQSALSRLTIFQGGFDPEAAEAVTGAGRGVLSKLESKSLLRRSAGGRFDLHEIIRQYAKNHLKDESALRDRHSEHYLGLLHRSSSDLFGADKTILLGRLFDELGNLNGAWEWALSQKRFALMDAALESLWMLYDVHGWLVDGIEQTRELIDVLRVETDAQIYLGRALTFHGMLIFRAGDYIRARKAFEEGIEILQGMNETKYLPPALIFNGIVVSLMGDFLYARRLMDEGVELAKEHSDRWFLALGQFDQGFIAGQEGNLDHAYERMQAGLSIWRELGNSRFIAFALNFLSPIAIQLGRLDDAQAYLEESLRLGTQIHDRWGMGTALGRLGGLALLKNDLPLAKTMLEKSLGLFTDLGAHWDIAWALTQLGKVAIASGAWEEAEDLLKRAMKLSLEAEAMPQAIDAALELAECLIQQGKFEKAAELILPATGHPASTDSAKQRAVKLGEIITQKMDSVDLEKIMEGKTMGEVIARFVY
jgi:predicted ATPase/DNA-binding XRE family transcriptional regulator